MDTLIWSKLEKKQKYKYIEKQGHWLNKTTSQKNSFPRNPQNHEIHETSSELLIVVTPHRSIHSTIQPVTQLHSSSSQRTAILPDAFINDACTGNITSTLLSEDASFEAYHKRLCKIQPHAVTVAWTACLYFNGAQTAYCIMFQYQCDNSWHFIPFKMGQITKTFLGDHLQIAWNFNTLIMNICIGCVQSLLKYFKYFLSYGCLNVATIVVFSFEIGIALFFSNFSTGNNFISTAHRTMKFAGFTECVMYLWQIN